MGMHASAYSTTLKDYSAIYLSPMVHRLAAASTSRTRLLCTQSSETVSERKSAHLLLSLPPGNVRKRLAATGGAG